MSNALSPLERQEQALYIVEQRITDEFTTDKVEIERVSIEGSTVALRILRCTRPLRRKFTEDGNTYTDEIQIPTVPFIDIIEVADVLGKRKQYIQRTRTQGNGYGFHIDRVTPAVEEGVQVRLWETDGQPTIARFALAKTIEECRAMIFNSWNHKERYTLAEKLPCSDTIKVKDHEIMAFIAETEINAATREPVVFGTPHWFSCVGPMSYMRACNTSVVDIPIES